MKKAKEAVFTAAGVILIPTIALIGAIAIYSMSNKGNETTRIANTDEIESPLTSNMPDEIPTQTTPNSTKDIRVVLPETEETTTAVSAPEENQNSKPLATTYEAGAYIVGNDIPVGEYVIFTDSTVGYCELSSDSSGSLNSIIANENFSYNTIMTLSKGQYFKMTNSYATPLESVAKLKTSGSGMFKVGKHLPAGEYKLIVDKNSNLGFGYVEVAIDSKHLLDSIRANENFENSTYITVHDGEYITLVGCYIQ